MQFDGPYHQSRGVNAHPAITIWEEFIYQFVLSFLQTLHAKRHSPQVGYLLFGVAQSQMAQETLVILVYLVSDESLLPKNLVAHHALELLYNLFENGLIKHQSLAIHHAGYVAPRKQFAAFEYNPIATCIEHVEPQFLIKNLARKDKHLNLGKLLLGVPANLYADGGRTTQTEVKQHQVGQLLFQQFPIRRFVICRPDDGCLRYFVSEYAFRTLQF